ncbi:sensor histidine kinase [Candidatus Hydrogenedentota bacterium]
MRLILDRMPLRGIFNKLVLTHLIITLVPLVPLSVYLGKNFEAHGRKSLERDLESQGDFVADYIKEMVGKEIAAAGDLYANETPPADVSDTTTQTLDHAREVFLDMRSFLRDLGGRTGMRYRLVDMNGEVIQDSIGMTRGVRVFMKNPDIETKISEEGAQEIRYDYRVEVVKALDLGNHAWFTRKAVDKSALYFCLACPINTDYGLVGVVYVNKTTGNIMEMLRDMKSKTIVCIVLGLLFATLISFQISRNITRPILSLTESSRIIAAGDTAREIRVKSKDEVGQLANALGEMKRQLAGQNYISSFVSTISHELKTPMAAIKGACEVLQDGAADDIEDRQRFLHNINAEAERVNRLIGELLDLSKIEATSREMTFALTDYAALVSSLIERLEPIATEKNQTVLCRIDENLPLIEVNRGRIEQVMTNLLDNAIKFTPPGGEVEVRILRENGHVVTVVEDTGPGINENDIGKIFERFYTGSRGSHGSIEGTGLGLAIVRSIIAAHSGVISAQNKPDKGALFRFRLPVRHHTRSQVVL